MRSKFHKTIEKNKNNTGSRAIEIFKEINELSLKQWRTLFI